MNFCVRSEQGIHLALGCRLDFQMRDFACSDGLVAAQGAGEDGGVAVMVGETGFGHATVGVGVTVATAMQAGVVLADVDALHAVADLALRGVFLDIDGSADDALDAVLIDAGSVLDAVGSEVDLFGARLQGDAGTFGKACKTLSKCCHLRDAKRVQRERLCVALSLAIEVEEADDAAVGVRRELLEHDGEVVQMTLDGVAVIEQDGVVAPDHARFAELLRHLLEGADDLALVGQTWLDVMAVRCDGELEVERILRVELDEMRQHRRGILRPEDDAIGIFGPQRDAADLFAVEWVDRVDEAFVDAVHEPRCIESRNVRPAAGTDDHG